MMDPRTSCAECGDDLRFAEASLCEYCRIQHEYEREQDIHDAWDVEEKEIGQ